MALLMYFHRKLTNRRPLQNKDRTIVPVPHSSTPEYIAVLARITNEHLVGWLDRKENSDKNNVAS